MGVSFPAIAFRVPSQNRDLHSGAGAVGSTRNVSNKKKKTTAAAVAADRRRRWWQLCREGDVRPASLGDFLEVERRVDDGAFYGTAAELESMVVGHQQRNGGRMLFADGRVLPPAEDVDGGESVAESLCNRFPVSLAGICSGGAG